MNNQLPEGWEQSMRQTAASFPYPATPDISGKVGQRLAARKSRAVSVRPRLAWGIAVILLIIGGLMVVPQTRAAVLRIIRAGAIAIFSGEPAPTAVPDASGAIPQRADEFIFELAEPISLAEAQDRAKVPLKLPAYPQELGAPDRLYLQEGTQQEAIIMVWLDPSQADEVLLSLYHIEIDDYAYKGTEDIKVVRVNGREAVWLDAPHTFQLQNGRNVPWLFVEGNVLIWWTLEGITYRLESGLALEEAIKIAESIK